MYTGSQVLVEMKAWVMITLDDHVTNEADALSSLKLKSGIPGHTSIADWNTARILGIVDGKTDTMHWHNGTKQTNFTHDVRAYEEKQYKEMEERWGNERTRKHRL